MPGILIVAHAPLASALCAVGRHVYPEGNLEALDVTQEMSPEDVESQARALLAKVADPQALVLTDVVGATPCSVVQRISDEGKVRVLTGVNVPMLWRALCYRNEPLEALVEKALSGAVQGVAQLTCTGEAAASAAMAVRP